jgi:arylsulfatase A-like enzyme
MLAARLRVLAWLGLGPGLVEAVSLWQGSDDAAWGLVVAAVGLGLWAALVQFLGLPYLVGGLSTWVRARSAVHGPDNPGPLAASLGLGLALLPGLLAAVALVTPLTARVAPASRPFLGLALGLALPAVSALAAPTLASLMAGLVPRRVRGPFTRLGLVLLASAGAAWVLLEVDDRLLPLAAVPLAAAIAGLPGRAVRLVGWLALFLAPALGAGALASLVHAGPEIVRGPATSGLLYGTLMPMLAELSDDDHDGFGDAFGGDDCDDAKASINPAARDMPRNGVDENCRGGDLTAAFDRPKLRPAPPLAPGLQPHIVLLVIDAVRFDSFGPESGLTPNLDRVAAAGRSFTRAMAQSSATRFSVPALLSGRWVAHTEYEEKLNVYTLDGSVPMLQSVLAAQGYRTGAVVPSVPHTQMPKLRKGFNDFDVIDTAEMRRLRDHSTPAAIDRILKQFRAAEDKPVFVYAHLMDAHHPYRKDVRRPKAPAGTKGDYQGEIAQLDADLAPLLAALEDFRKTRPVLLVVTADHGEGFMEHGTRYHARDLFQTSLHVPLIFHGPGVVAGPEVDTPVDLLDVGVTLAEFGGAALPGAQGSSLRGLLAGHADTTRRPLFAELRVWRLPYPHHAAIIDWPWKLMVRMDTGQRQLFDLDADPGERRNLWGQAPEAGPRLDALLSRWSEYGNGPAGRLLPEGLVEK